MFNASLQHALAQGQRHDRSLAVFFLDLDRFKNINDTLGHQFGDKVLKEAAARLARSVRTSDIVARLGGDEFVLLVEEFGPPSVLTEIAQKLLVAMSQTAVIDGHEISLSASVGICTYPEEGRDAQTLLANADIAMYRAKAQGGNSFCFYSAQMNFHSLERLALEAGLRRALERGELRVYYQPKIDVASSRMTGVEALLRWEHPELGLLSPEKFIPIAEETGLIVPIGLWVIRNVCERSKAWQARGMATLSVAVNLSARQFRQESLVADLEEILRATGTPGAVLELEITESMVMQDPERAAEQMDALRRMGVRLAIDDFRHRLLVARLPEALSHQQPQDRPRLRARPAPRHRRPCDHRAIIADGPQPAPERDRRRRRAPLAAGPAGHRGVRRVPGVLLPCADERARPDPVHCRRHLGRHGGLAGARTGGLGIRRIVQPLADFLRQADLGEWLHDQLHPVERPWCDLRMAVVDFSAGKRRSPRRARAR